MRASKYLCTPRPQSLMKNGLLIVLEGIDGTGKSTQSRALATWLRAQGHDVVLSREPTDGPWGKQLRDSAQTGRLSPGDELECFLKDRRQHVEELILPSIACGKIVVLDRYYFSTMAYQGARGLDPAGIRKLNEEFAPTPDLLLILDLAVDTALERIGSRGDTANEFEQRAALQTCRDIFLSLRDEAFCRVIDASQNAETVADDIRETVLDALDGPLSS